MPKILIETGSESHSTSSASVIAKYVGGPNAGKHLYEVKSSIGSTKWDVSNDNHKKWVESVFDLPDETKFEIIGRGRTGARGADKSEFHQVFIVDSDEEVRQFTIDVGLRDTDFKGCVRIENE